jgi:hypothetical protein
MQQFGHARSDERDPQQVAVVQVDDDTGAPGVAVGVEVGARNSLADVDVDDFDPGSDTGRTTTSSRAFIR